MYASDFVFAKEVERNEYFIQKTMQQDSFNYLDNCMSSLQIIFMKELLDESSKEFQ